MAAGTGVLVTPFLGEVLRGILCSLTFATAASDRDTVNRFHSCNYTVHTDYRGRCQFRGSLLLEGEVRDGLTVEWIALLEVSLSVEASVEVGEVFSSSALPERRKGGYCAELRYSQTMEQTTGLCQSISVKGL